MKTLVKLLLPFSIIPYLMIFGMDLGVGYLGYISFLDKILDFLSIFGGYIIQIIIVLFAVFFIFRRRHYDLSKKELNLTLISIVSAGIYITLFTIMAIDLARTGLH